MNLLRQTPESRRGYEYEKGASHYRGKALVIGCLATILAPIMLACLAMFGAAVWMSLR